MSSFKRNNVNNKSVKAKTVKQVKQIKTLPCSKPTLLLTSSAPTTSYGKALEKRMPIFRIDAPANLSTPHLRFTRRFTSSAPGGGNVLYNDMHNQFIIAATTTLGYNPFIVWRIRRIRMWCSAVTTTEGYVSLTPGSATTDNVSSQSPPQTYRDETTTIDVPAHIDVKPDVNHPLGTWHYTSATSASSLMFAIEYGDPTVMDIHFEGILNMNALPQGYTRTLVAATVGTIYAATITSAHMIPNDVNYL